jgi:transposase
MRAYSTDLRERIVHAVASGQRKATVARTYRVSLSTVKRYVSQHAATGRLLPRRRTAPPPRIGGGQYPALLAQLDAAPDATLAEHCQMWEEAHGVRVSVPTMWRAIARVGWTPKKSR